MKKLIVLLSCLISASLFSAGLKAEDCEFEKQIDMKLDLAGSDSLAVIAKAGKLTITGSSDTNEAIISGTVCVSKESWLEKSSVETRGGKSARIEVNLPSTDGGWMIFGDRYARLDLELIVPDDLRLDVKDSSGSMDIRGVGALKVKDSSGSIEIEDTNGPVSLEDSSGSITLNRIGGDVTIVSDSSGSISGRDINGFVLVKKDSSGSIHFTDVTHDFIVEQDSSGGIVAERIGGDFKVFKDSSGGIRSSDIAGEVSIPKG